MPDEQRAILSIQAESGVPLYLVRNLLGAVDAAYNYIYLTFSFLENQGMRARLFEAITSESERRYGRLVPAEDRLILKSVVLHSPGSWDLLGVGKILEQIRLYLNDRNERRKDKEYREPHDRRSVELDERLKEADLAIKETTLLHDRIKLAKEAGATDEEIRLILERFLVLPLSGLDRFQDAGLISEASLEPQTTDKDE
jgi:hypothetical protein